MSLELCIQKIYPEIDDLVYAHEGDAGFDLRSAENTILEPNTQALISTGVKMAIPEGYVGLIWDRSGLAAKHGIHVLAGVVDSGYRGEVKVVMRNFGTEPLTITVNMRIAQMLIQAAPSVHIKIVDTLDDTNRGEGGFGSTGHT